MYVTKSVNSNEGKPCKTLETIVGIMIEHGYEGGPWLKMRVCPVEVLVYSFSTHTDDLENNIPDPFVTFPFRYQFANYDL